LTPGSLPLISSFAAYAVNRDPHSSPPRRSSDLTSYALTATAAGLIPATSSGFTITPGAATQIVFGTQPGTTVANRQISPAVKVRAVEDTAEVETRVTDAGAIALGNNTGGSTLSG